MIVVLLFMVATALNPTCPPIVNWLIFMSLMT